MRKFRVDYRHGKADYNKSLEHDSSVVISVRGSLPEARIKFIRQYGKLPIIGISEIILEDDHDRT